MFRLELPLGFGLGRGHQKCITNHETLLAKLTGHEWAGQVAVRSLSPMGAKQKPDAVEDTRIRFHLTQMNS